MSREMTSTEIDQMVLQDLNVLADQAEREGLWLWSCYQDLWFSPKEIRAYWKKGSFRWGPCNWKLRNPQEHVQELRRDLEEKKVEIDNFWSRLAQG